MATFLINPEHCCINERTTFFTKEKQGEKVREKDEGTFLQETNIYSITNSNNAFNNSIDKYISSTPKNLSIINQSPSSNYNKTNIKLHSVSTTDLNAINSPQSCHIKELASKLMKKYLEMKLQADILVKEKEKSFDLRKKYEKEMMQLKKDKQEFEVFRKKHSVKLIKEVEQHNRLAKLQGNKVKYMMRTSKDQNNNQKKIQDLENKIKLLELDLEREKAKNRTLINNRIKASSYLIIKDENQCLQNDKPVIVKPPTNKNLWLESESLEMNSDQPSSHRNYPLQLKDGTLVSKTIDGLGKIYTFQDGRREIHTREWKKKIYPDGTTKMVFANGQSKEVTYPDGRKTSCRT